MWHVGKLGERVGSIKGSSFSCHLWWPEYQVVAYLMSEAVSYDADTVGNAMLSTEKRSIFSPGLNMYCIPCLFSCLRIQRAVTGSGKRKEERETVGNDIYSITYWKIYCIKSNGDILQRFCLACLKVSGWSVVQINHWPIQWLCL